VRAPCCVRSCREDAPAAAEHSLATVKGIGYVLKDNLQSTVIDTLYVCQKHLVGKAAVNPSKARCKQQTVSYKCISDECHRMIVYR